jgi:hypothetical protein
MVKFYQVEVFSRGELITRHTVEAPDALSAINLVEISYGTPPRIEDAVVELEGGRKEHLLVVLDWHGYSFLARQIRATPP